MNESTLIVKNDVLRFNEIFKGFQKVELIKFAYIIKQLSVFRNNKFTGQLRINFYEGNLSEKVEKKESIKINE